MYFKSKLAKVQSFETLIQSGRYYVDKTMFIRELLDEHPFVTMIHRPSNFGKSLTLDMLRCFFSPTEDPHLFDDLAISQETALCQKYKNQYPVLHLDLSALGNVPCSEAMRCLAGQISSLAFRYESLCQSGKLPLPDNSILQTYMALADPRTWPVHSEDLDVLLEFAPHTMCRILHWYYGKDVIVLIDGYDVPLRKAGSDRMRNVLEGMLHNLLQTNRFLQFAVITGCVNLTRDPVFERINCLYAWDAADNFAADSFGFTEQEISELLRFYRLSEAMDTVRGRYHGHRFGGEPLSCPWDILSYIDHCLIDNTTEPLRPPAEDGSHPLLRALLQEGGSSALTLLEGGTIQKPLTALTCRNLDQPEGRIWSLLVAEGYLTVAGIAETTEEDEEEAAYLACADGNLYELAIPTGQVREWFEEVLQNSKTAGDLPA